MKHYPNQAKAVLEIADIEFEDTVPASFWNFLIRKLVYWHKDGTTVQKLFKLSQQTEKPFTAESFRYFRVLCVLFRLFPKFCSCSSMNIIN
jgi:hypothetical protein